jgi:hypothetical protein
MDKLALDFDPPAIGRFALGGALTGASSAALLNLVRMLRDMRQEQVDANKPEDTDENTIVLTLPGKEAEVVTDKPTTVTTTKPAVTTSTSTGPGSQYRRPAGTFGNKTATAWPTLTVGVLAGLGGIVGGAHLVNRIYQKRRERELQGDLEAARQEYLDALTGDKTAEAFDQLLGLDGFSKEASITGMLNVPLAASAIMAILGAGGAGYVTKRILDEKLLEKQDKGMDIPRAQRIVFRSQPQLEDGVPISSDDDDDGDEKDKEASAQDISLIKAAVCVMVDALDAEPRILNTPYVKEACAEAGVDQEALLKAAQDIDSLVQYLQQMRETNPELQKMIVRAGMEQHPMLKHFRWATDIPGVTDFMYRRGSKKLIPKVQGILGPEKVAAFPLLSSIVGSSIAENAGRDDTAERVVALQEAKSRQKQPKEEAETIDILGDDPAAEEYVDENRERIIALLEQLVRQGKL